MPKTILIVDDYPEFAQLLEERLKTEGYRIETAFDGSAGIEKAKALKPDLILLDIMMPQVGGTEVRAELMKEPGTRGIPIIFLTGLRAPQANRKTPIYHDLKVIGKSRDFKELLEAIQETLKNSPEL